MPRVPFGAEGLSRSARQYLHGKTGNAGKVPRVTGHDIVVSGQRGRRDEKIRSGDWETRSSQIRVDLSEDAGDRESYGNDRHRREQRFDELLAASSP